MDLSSDVQNSYEKFRFLKNRSESVSPNPSASKSDCEFDTLDVSKITFDTDETWLYETSSNCDQPISNLNDWLYNDLIETNNSFSSDQVKPVQDATQYISSKNIDTRTFTRPKKRFARPSIEKYNEEVYGSGSDSQNERSPSSNMKRSLATRMYSDNSTGKEMSESVSIPTKPLNFDLSQPTNSYYFENVLANSAEIDSFQNMSPPSLVNSMCSSTFANLMESSFIKNDPVLREIRDTDYTETVLLQDSEPPMFQSITESCSSINSDTPESFLKKVSFNATFRKNLSKDSEKTFSEKSLDTTFEVDTTLDKSNETGSKNSVEVQNSTYKTEVITNQSCNNFNGTYRRSPKPNGTFRKSDVKKATLALNSTFEMPPNDAILDQNTTKALIKDCSIKSFENKKSISSSRTILNDITVEDMKKQLSETVQITDLNRLSYCLDDENVNLEKSYNEDNNEINRTVNMKRSSLGCSTGSADSLDRMSSLSNSSRESSKMLNMADVDAIVEMQERSLNQVMSTPKPNSAPKKLWENNFISPITSNEQMSDSDLSSSDEYKSVKSTYSKASVDVYHNKSAKSLGYLGRNIDTKLKTNQRSTYTLTGQKPLQAISSNVRASCGNLKTIQTNIFGSQSNLYKPSNVIRPVTSSTTNLKTMGQKLKGSYTSLRPISAFLPVAPPINSQLNTTTTLPRATNPNVTQNIDSGTKIVQVAPMPREKVNIVGDNHFVKPQAPRVSALPRPTGIPRPAASKIPGPRSTNIRPSSARPSNIRRQTKDNYQ